MTQSESGADAPVDLAELRRRLLAACRTAFPALRAAHAGERFYCMGLYTTGLFSYLVPTAMTEEGLASTVLRYRSDPRFSTESDEQLTLSLRWNPCDSPLHLEGEQHFDALDDFMPRVVSRFDSIDIDNWDEFNEFHAAVTTAICDVLRTLDAEGIFGEGPERERVFVSVMMGDQDDSILRVGRLLNPASTYERFRQDWIRLSEMYGTSDATQAPEGS